MRLNRSRLLPLLLAVVSLALTDAGAARLQATSSTAESSAQEGSEPGSPANALSFAGVEEPWLATPVTLAVDAGEAPRRILHSRMTLAVQPGPLTLYYPKWIPGEHAPSGPVADLTGLVFTAAGKRIPWKRDPLDLFAFHLEIPDGAREVEIALDYVSPTDAPAGVFTQGASSSEQLAIINWNQLLLYPAQPGRNSQALRIPVSASLKLPAGWSFGTALSAAPHSNHSGETASPVQFATVPLAELMDSPVLAGRYFRSVNLDEPNDSANGEPRPTHRIDIVADSPSALAIAQSDRQAFTGLIGEAGTLFGWRPYRNYRFLLALSNQISHFGMEHLESSDNRLVEPFLTDPAARLLSGSLLPHEYVHAWNGKYRQPAELSAPDFQTPRKTGLLWVYEGLTSYLSMVLTARSGLWTPEQFRDQLAMLAMQSSYRAGRRWRSLEDTAISAQLLFDAGPAWTSWRRGPDFYDEGVLVWLEADVIIRRQSHRRRSLDDFARFFFGPASPGTYTSDDVVSALNRIAPYDWKSFFEERVSRVSPTLSLESIRQAGWSVVYNEVPNEAMRLTQEVERTLDASASLGLMVQGDGKVVDTIPGMPAALAGLAPGMRIAAVNGRRFSPRVLLEALHAGAVNRQVGLELLVENADFFKTLTLDYHDGSRYPRLVRDDSHSDLLNDILRPRRR